MFGTSLTLFVEGGKGIGFFGPQTLEVKEGRDPSTGSGTVGGTAARRDGVRVFEQFPGIKLVPSK